MDHVDFKYIGLISSHLPQFKKKNNAYNCRCPFCGDSKKNKYKARGYILENKGATFFKCHNCGVSTTLLKLIEHCNGELAGQYRAEKFIEKQEFSRVKLVDKKPDITSAAKPVFIAHTPLKQLKKISQLRPDHPVKKYIDRRMIPTTFHHKLFLATKFKTWVNSFVPDKFDLNQPDEPRLVIPMLDAYGNLIGLQGRSFSKDSIRYITIIVDETKPKVYGLDHTDITKHTYMLEGPIDSMFIPNSLAMVGADCLQTIKDLQLQDVTIIYDNEPRNKEICRRIEKMIDLNYRVCIWPDHIVQKDVNDMVIAGIKPADIKLIIDNNSFSGLDAKLRFNIWRKN